MNHQRVFTKLMICVGIAALSIPLFAEPEQRMQETRTISYGLSQKAELYPSSNSLSSYACHWIDSLPAENVIKLEDGSEWMFQSSLAFQVRSWRRGDILLLSPKINWIWLSDYSYVLTNKTLNASVEVNPHLGPLAYGDYSTWVRGIDYKKRQIYLINGQGEATTWVISDSDQELFEDWKVNDHVIIANNDSWAWWFSAFNHIVINVSMNHHVHARQL